MKKIIDITGITLLIVLIAVPVFAWGPGTGRGMRNFRNYDGRVADLTPDQQEQLQGLHKKFRDETADARTEMMKKRIDLRAIIETDNPDVKKAKAIQKEISELQAKIAQKRVEFLIEAKKINPDMPFGRSLKMGAGMRGMRRGMGPGI